MSELPNTDAAGAVTPPTPAAEPLYAGKYKSIGDFENAYTESQRKISEMGAKLKEFSPPETYVIEAEVSEETKTQLLAAAKDASLSQAQLKKLATQLESNEKAMRTSHENSAKEVLDEVGIDKIQKLDAYLDQSFPKKIADALKENYKSDKTMAQELYAHREHALSGAVPAAGSSVSVGSAERKSEMYALAAKLLANPNDMAARSRYEQLGRSVIQSSL